MSDIVLETRVKLEDLYKALLYMESIGSKPKSRSAIASHAISLISSLYEGPVPSPEEMLSSIKDHFCITLTKGFTPSGRSSISSTLKRKLQEDSALDVSSTETEEEKMQRMMEGLLKRGKV